ncbi:transcription factor S [Sulfolobales archaeon HS-7]|nr:transcription factor S [Sulfolobales archaeon HS-7]
MKFCPKCNSMLLPRKVNGVSKLVCSKCGYEEESAEKTTLKTTVKHTVHDKTLVIEEETASAQRIKGVVCPNCKNDEAYFWMLQTRSADEPATRFYRCVKCNKVWREYE